MSVIEQLDELEKIVNLLQLRERRVRIAAFEPYSNRDIAVMLATRAAALLEDYPPSTSQ